MVRMRTPRRGRSMVSWLVTGRLRFTLPFRRYTRHLEHFHLEKVSGARLQLGAAPRLDGVFSDHCAAP